MVPLRPFEEAVAARNAHTTFAAAKQRSGDVRSTGGKNRICLLIAHSPLRQDRCASPASRCMTSRVRAETSRAYRLSSPRYLNGKCLAEACKRYKERKLDAANKMIFSSITLHSHSRSTSGLRHNSQSTFSVIQDGSRIPFLELRALCYRCFCSRYRNQGRFKGPLRPALL